MAAAPAVRSVGRTCIRAVAYFVEYQAALGRAVTYKTLPPYTAPVPNVPNKWVGAVPDIMDIISQNMETCYTVTQADDGLIGEQLLNGTWTGAIGQVVRRADMIITPFLLNIQRDDAVDVSDFLWPTPHSAVHKKAEVKPDIAGFIKPFSLGTWCYILGVFAACACSLYFLLSTEDQRGMTKSERSCAHPSRMRDICISFFTVLRFMLGQPAEGDRRLSVSRVLMGTMIASWLILGTMYKTFLMSMLVLPRVPEPFSSLEELVTRRPMPYLVVRGSFLHTALQEADPKTILGRANANIGLLESDYKKLLGHVIAGRYAALSARSASYGAMQLVFDQTRTCPLTIKDSFLTTLYAVAFQKNSRFTAHFNKRLLRLRESGILGKTERQWVKSAFRCLEAADETHALRPLEMRDFYGVFLLYTCGLTLASVTFVFEVGRRRKITAEENKSTRAASMT